MLVRPKDPALQGEARKGIGLVPPQEGTASDTQPPPPVPARKGQLDPSHQNTAAQQQIMRDLERRHERLSPDEGTSQ